MLQFRHAGAGLPHRRFHRLGKPGAQALQLVVQADGGNGIRLILRAHRTPGIFQRRKIQGLADAILLQKGAAQKLCRRGVRHNTPPVH